MRLGAVARSVRTGLAAVFGVFITVGLSVSSASAHVTVNPSVAAQGSVARLTFRVPNEKPNANTVRLEVVFPTATPITSVAVKPVNGWAATVVRAKLATPVTTPDGQITESVAKVVWRASAAGQIKPGEFQEFDLTAGPLPAVGQIVFKALQFYSDGDVVRWIDEPVAGQEQEHPAPVLMLTTAGVGGVSMDGMDMSKPVRTDAANPAAVRNTSRSSVALGLAIAALVIGVAGLLLALVGLQRSRVS